MGMEELLRALTSTGAGSVLLQPEIDKVIQQLVDYRNPLRQQFSRKPGSGQAYILNRRTPGTTAADFVNDTDTIPEETGSYAQVSFPYKTLATQGKVTRFLQATGKSYSDVLRDELERKAEDFKDKEDYFFLWGQAVADTPISGMGGVKQWDGINALATEDATNIVAVTDSVNGADLTIAKMDEALERARLDPSNAIIISSFVGRRKLNALLQSQQRFNDKTEIRGGFRVQTYNDVPILTSTNIPDTLGFSGTDINSLSGTTATTALFIVDLGKTFISELTKLTVMPLAKTTSQHDLFDIFEDEVPVLRDPRGIIKVVGIKVAD